MDNSGADHTILSQRSRRQRRMRPGLGTSPAARVLKAPAPAQSVALWQSKQQVSIRPHFWWASYLGAIPESATFSCRIRHMDAMEDVAERVRFELTCRNYPTIRFRVGAVMTASVPVRA